MKNMELLDLYTARILALLYETFPERVSLSLQYITQMELNQEEPLPKQAQIARETVLWLKENGFITFDEDEFYTFTKARLTEKGLTILRKPYNPQI